MRSPTERPPGAPTRCPTCGSWVSSEPGGAERPKPVSAGPQRTLALTARERETLTHLVAGLTNGEIASRLGCSQRTVQSHVSASLNKTGARNRVALAVLAVREGTVPAPEEAS